MDSGKHAVVIASYLALASTVQVTLNWGSLNKKKGVNAYISSLTAEKT